MNTAKKVPMRKCVGCQEMKIKKELIRVLKTEDGDITLDKTGRQNGRGAYICYSKECLEKAIRNKGLERSLKQPIPDEVYDKLRRELEEF